MLQPHAIITIMSTLDSFSKRLESILQMNASELLQLDIALKKAYPLTTAFDEVPQYYTTPFAQDSGKVASVMAYVNEFCPPPPTGDQCFAGGQPEQYADEVFLGNFETIVGLLGSYRTKRKGFHAYDINGRKVPGLYPVFVKRQEVEERGWVVTADGRISRENPATT